MRLKDKNHPSIAAIRAHQKQKGLKREDIAFRAGVGLVTINRLMSGDIPKEDTLRKIEEGLNIRLTSSFQMVADADLGEYPKSWCDPLIGEYLSVRQNRWENRPNVINTFPVKFDWCEERPGLKMSWEFRIDKDNIRRQSAYVSMTNKDGHMTIVNMNHGAFSSTHLMREDPECHRLFGVHCGLGEVRKGQRSIVSQVVAYIRPSKIDFKFDNQILPGGRGHREFTRILSSIEGVFAHMISPPSEKI